MNSRRASRSRARFERIELWRAEATRLVEETLRQHAADSVSAAELAGALVAMFDAGASEREAVVFLEQQTVAGVPLATLAAGELHALAIRVHRAAAGKDEFRPSA
jgi:hypothetical protein